MKIKILITIAVLALAGTAAFFGLKAWRNNIAVKQEQRAFTKAEELIKGGQPDQAWQLIRTQQRPKSKLEWPTVEVEALAGMRDASRLAQIFEVNPARVERNEEASLVLARAYMSGRNSVDYNKVRSVWKGHETRKDDWLALDCDLLQLAGKPREAEKLLRSVTLTGKAEAARLERLSLMVAGRDLPQAWQLLADATALDPRNSELRSFRAQILETAGKPEAARVEYTAALAADQKNPLLRDQLAEFFLRQGNYDYALKLWTACLPDPTFDFVWLKTAFWARMIHPVTLDASKVSEGDLQPLARWVIGLPAGQFGDTNTFAQLPLARNYAGQRQEVFWLQVADALQHHREREAAQLLQFNSFHARSWQPDLESALQRILHYRFKKNLNPEGFNYTSTTAATNQHQFFATLEALAARERADGRVAVPADLDALLRGPDAFAAAFLAAGWRGAALNLCSVDNCPTNEPAWFAYGIAESLRLNENNAAAETFIARQKADPALNLLSAEMLIGDGQGQAGINMLPELARLNTPVGYRASYLLALACADAKQYDTAAKWVTQNPLLANDQTGQELLAGIALKAGQPARAEAIYRAIEAGSVPAKAYFAKKAFDQKDWKLARELTSQLIRMAPDELQFRANLADIDRAEASVKK